MTWGEVAAAVEKSKHSRVAIDIETVGEEIFPPLDSPDIEPRWLVRMVTSQGLQILSTDDSFTGLGVVANGIVSIDFVFRVHIACCRRLPVRVQGLTDLLLLHALLPLRAEVTKITAQVYK